MEEKEILDVFKKAGAIVTGSHIVYTSGRHGSAYVNKDALYLHPGEVGLLCKEAALRCAKWNAEVVAGPTMGGIILSQWTAFHLSAILGRGILSVFAEEGPDKRRLFGRGYAKIVSGRKVLVVEDVLTTGASAAKVVEAVRETGGEPVAVQALVNRGGVTEKDVGGPPLAALISVSLESFPEEDCPLCRQGIPVNTEVGKGKDFLARRSR